MIAHHSRKSKKSNIYVGPAFKVGLTIKNLRSHYLNLMDLVEICWRCLNMTVRYSVKIYMWGPHLVPDSRIKISHSHYKIYRIGPKFAGDALI
jgi:hypothetical protein